MQEGRTYEFNAGVALFMGPFGNLQGGLFEATIGGLVVASWDDVDVAVPGNATFRGRATGEFSWTLADGAYDVCLEMGRSRFIWSFAPTPEMSVDYVSLLVN